MAATRTYELKRRAERQEETRRRIVAAAVELHTTVAPVLPVLRELNAYRVRYLEGVRELLVAGWPSRGRARMRLRRALGHALDFRTWQSLVRGQGSRTDEAVQLMVAL